jgi:hypothetical protein
MLGLQYEVRIKPKQKGGYLGQVFRDGLYAGGTFSGTRDEVIAKAKDYVEWHKNGGSEEEVVAL